MKERNVLKSSAFTIFGLMAPGLAMAALKAPANEITDVSVGGYIQLDAVYSSVSAGANQSADHFFIGSSVPLDSTHGESDQLKISARESRIWLKSGGQYEHWQLTAKLEGDFYGAKPTFSETYNNNSDFRIRHAYLQADYDDNHSFLIGQYWSAFQNTRAFPHTTTIGTLPGQAFSRTPQIRYQYNLAYWQLYASLENPESNLLTEQGESVRPDDDKYPDLVLGVKQKHQAGQISLSVLYRSLSCEQYQLCHDSEDAWGISVAGEYNFDARNQLRYQLNRGNGIGRYVSGVIYPDAVLGAQGNLFNTRVTAGMLSFQHTWRDDLTSAVIFNYADSETQYDTSGSAVVMTDKITTLNVNLQWWPVPEKWRLSMEVLRANTRLSSDAKGDLSRVMLSSRYYF
ncbi:DcaP family trimeric outer membrane transporter [Pseudoalteromonas sp. OOF1S-7]|uniref:DcaP family trimeric outer membrane transporter n=1 Tax=Pseudoalteromonas sp. OOF1S-7 TaxID=2917757 RepID=UPI001EF5CB78|nr:DcaP family trimeric outer membrane transporter [Pseudoalteromonas sp. OOF1S-7]MCG7533907.1 DcaP family trimeric outer membrane transporter [Pseudoalteromonas sp. OOF1S-7]